MIDPGKGNQICIIIVFAAMLLAACYDSSSGSGTDPDGDATSDSSSDSALDSLDSADHPSESIDPPDLDLDSYEFDGYLPESCSLFMIHVEWEGEPESTDTYVSSSFYESSDEPMLSVISIYEAFSCPDENEYCPVKVHVSRTYRPVALLLNSHHSIEWIIEPTEGAQIDKIMVTGMYPSSITAPEGVSWSIRDEGEYYFGHCWPHCVGSDTRNDIEEFAEYWGVPLASFHGANDVDGVFYWHICRDDCLEEVVCAGRECGRNECGYDCGTCPEDYTCVDFQCVPCSSNCIGRECGSDGCGGTCGSCLEDYLCNDGSCVPSPYMEACAEVMSETNYCFTIDNDGAALVGLESGLICPVGKRGTVLSNLVPMYTSSIAVLDGHMYVCVDDSVEGEGVHGILEVSLLDGSWEILPPLCSALTRYGDGLLVQPDLSFGPSGIVHYPTIEHVRADDGTRLAEEVDAFRMTVNGDMLYTAWHTTDHVDMFQLPSGSALETIYLEDYDTGIQGMAVTDDGFLASIAPWHESRIAIFDTGTGSHVRDIGLAHELWGLDCRTNP